MSSPPADNSSSSFDNLSSSLSAPPPPSSLNSPPPSSSNSSVLPPSPPLLSPPPPSTSKSSPPPSKLDNDDESSSPPLPSPPPPPPHPHKFSSSHPKELTLPSHHDGESNRSQDHSYRDHQFDVNLPVLTGIVAGVGLFFVLMIIICICCSKKKKRRNPMHYYTEGSTYNDSGGFYSRGLPQNWRDENKVVDYAVKVPLPQPPSTMMSTSDANSSYSGPHGPSLPPPSPTIALGFNKSTFSYEELAAATNGFSDANLLGQGGFGYVYKGVLPNGKEIAVKQLKSECGQGEREFQAEVEIISRVHHRHLVSLVGYCSAGSQRLLVYEFVPNNTLEYHLYGKGLPVVMNWSTRLRIALGSAKGLAYLHEDCHPRIIHRDIKAANILLDFKFEAMVADFGLAKLSSDNHTHVSTRVMGTLGYLAPEYASSGKLTEKSDVFSFGVMLLELITGRRPVDSSQFVEDSLVDWARPILSRALADGNYDELADPRLDGKFHPMEMARMVAAAAASVRHSAKRRPRMSQIVRALEGDVSLEDLNDGVRPGQWAEHALQLRS